MNNIPIFLTDGRLRDSVQKFRPQLLILAMRRNKFDSLLDDLIWSAQQGVEVWDAPTFYERLEKRIPIQYVDKDWLLFAAINRPSIHIRHLKRIMDVFIAAFGLILSFPIIVLTSISICFESPGPVLLIQKRLGKNGKIINLYKFRSMYVKNEQYGTKRR